MPRAPRSKVTNADKIILGSLRGRHRGEKCAIICNGWSLPERERLKRIRQAGVTVIGVNTSCVEIEPGAPFIESDYHVIVDPKAEAVYAERITEHNATWLFTRSRMSHRMSIKLTSMPKGMVFSDDLAEGAVFAGAGYVGLQAAVHLGFRDIVFVALDLRVKTPTGKKSQVHYYKNAEGLHNTYSQGIAPTIFLTQTQFMNRAKKLIEDRGLADRIVNTSTTNVAPWAVSPFDVEFPGG